MGAITGLLGLNGQPTNPVNQGQIQGSITGSQNALTQQQGLLNALQGQNGLANQSSVYNQLQGVANGTGPNPAQTMLNQATGQNVANQASLAAGQRGAASNVGLIARQAAQQGSNAQQQAAGQAATMQANQSLGALGQLNGIANQQVQNQIGATGAVTQANQAQQGAMLGAQQGYNSNLAGMQNAETKNQGNALAGLGNGIATALNLAGGGRVPPQQAPQGPQSSLGMYLAGAYAAGGNVGSALKSGGHVPGTPKVGGAVNSYSNDTVDAKLSPGEIVLPRSVTMSKDPVGAAAKFVQATLAKKRGGK